MIGHLKYALHFVHGKLREGLKTIARSPKWPAVRDKYLETHDECAACGTKKHLNVHHIEPYHLHPDLELVESNFITLCLTRNLCHLKIGHGDNYRMYNPNVVHDAAHVRAHPETRPDVEKLAMSRRKAT